MEGAKGSTRPGRKVARKIFRAFRRLDSARRCGLSGLETTVEGTGEGERERSETNTILESETGSETRFVLTRPHVGHCPYNQPPERLKQHCPNQCTPASF